MEIDYYAHFMGNQKVIIEGTDFAVKLFKSKYLMKDIHGNILKDGDEIQGYHLRVNNDDHLFKTNVIKVTYPGIYRLLFGGTFEVHPKTGEAWVWKVTV